MKSSIRELVKACDLEGLARYLGDNFGLILSPKQLRSILEEAAYAGGPDNDPWTDSTWRMWLKVKVTQTPQAKRDWETEWIESSQTLQEKRNLEDALIESSEAVFNTPDFEIRGISHWDDLTDEFPEESWDKLFPAAESVGGVFKEQFQERGGHELLGEIPFASWLYARLTFLGIAGVKEENDLGGYEVCFILKADKRLAGILFLEADSECVEVIIEAQTSGDAEKIRKQFVGLLLQQIKDVARCKLEIHGAEVGWTNYYG